MNYRKTSLLVLLLAATSQAHAVLGLKNALQSIKNINRRFFGDGARTISCFSEKEVNTIKVGQIITLNVDTTSTPKQGDPTGMKGDMTYFDIPRKDGKSQTLMMGEGSVTTLIADMPTLDNRVAKIEVERKDKEPTVYTFKIVKK